MAQKHFQPFTRSSLCGPGNHKPHKYLCSCVLNVTRMHQFMLKFQFSWGSMPLNPPIAGRPLHGWCEWNPPLVKSWLHPCKSLSCHHQCRSVLHMSNCSCGSPPSVTYQLHALYTWKVNALVAVDELAVVDMSTLEISEETYHRIATARNKAAELQEETQDTCTMLNRMWDWSSEADEPGKLLARPSRFLYRVFFTSVKRSD